MRILLVSLAIIFIAGCSTRLQEPDNKSGFLNDYHLFKPNPSAEDSWVRVTQHFDLDKFKAYDKIAIAPVELWLNKNEPYLIKDKGKQEALTRYLEDTIKAKFNGRKQIVEQGTPGALLIRTAITHLGEKSPDFQARDLLPFRIVKNAGESAYLAATDQKSVIGRAGLEVEFVDNDSGNGLVAVILDSLSDELTVADKPNNIDALKAVVDNWAERLVSAFDEAENSR